ncbi:hypothetical protein [Fibrella aquatilis]|uniref:Uncharacterized protein n=1 Tax=Fibrella aquatilis TaxID=2817059 RepID=A0A939JYG3_9BACT|nr:hypothetical protein [Fibrella aquatilis]MBO0932064.1 hypothetical protein [Fibrella aquatilis]
MEDIDLSDYENFKPDFNLSLLNLMDLKSQGVLSQDIKDVCINPRSRWANLEGFPTEECFFKVIGFSRLNFRPLLVALSYQDNKITVHQVEPANEDDIETDYCGQ